MVFVSYAHEDNDLRKKLDTHLSLLKTQRLIQVWYDQDIRAGTEWEHEIQTYLDQADIILLLISPDFIDSKYLFSVEMQRALKRHERGEAHVIPIIVRPVDWHSAPFSKLPVLPTNTKPILSPYWPYVDEAFLDVVEGIRKVLEKMIDQPLPLPLSTLDTSKKTLPPPERLQTPTHPAILPPHWNVPAWNNPYFLGRDEQLASLEQVFQPNRNRTATASPAPHQVISGLGGIGKTQLAIEYAYRHYRHYQAVFWVRAATTQELVTGYIELAHLLDLPQKDEQDTTMIREAVKAWLQTHDQWLLIFDNADEPDLLADFLPAHMAGHILITTRRHDLQEQVISVDLDALDEATSALFLLRRIRRLALGDSLDQANEGEQKLAQELSRELGGLPLALEQAGIYMHKTRKSLADYLALYQTHRAKLLGRRKDMPHHYPEPVATTWDISFERVIQRNAAAADLFHFCAFLAPDAIPEEIIVGGAEYLGELLQKVAGDELEFDDLLADVQAYSLLRRDGERKMLFLHRLVQAVIRDRLDQETQQEWQQRVINVLAMQEVFPEPRFETQEQSQRIIFHALECLRWEDCEALHSEEMIEICYKVARYFHDQGQYKEAEAHLQRALHLYERTLPEYIPKQFLDTIHPIRGNILHALANIYQAQGRYKEAEAFYIQASHIKKRLIDICPKTNMQMRQPLLISMNDTLNNLAVLYYKQGSYAAAEPLYKETLHISEYLRGLEHVDTAQSLNNLGELYRVQKRLVEAEALLVRALDIRERIQGLEHPAVASTLNSLGTLYQDQKRYEQAEGVLKRSLSISEQTQGQEHPTTASILNNLAYLYGLQGKDEEAQVLYQRALSIIEERLSPKHPYMSITLSNQALLGKSKGARKKEAPKGALSMKRVASLYDQALFFMNQGKYEQAEQTHQQILTLQEQALESDDPNIAASLNNLATVYQLQGRHSEAEAFSQQSLRIIEQALGPDHSDAVGPLTNLATLFMYQGKSKEAEAFLRRSLDIWERVRGPEHTDVACILHKLAAFYGAEGKYTEAQRYCQRALKIYQQSFGFSHSTTREAQHLYNKITRNIDK